MNNTYQIVLMLLNNLSNDFKYDEFENNVMTSISEFDDSSSFKPPVESNAQIPADFPRRIINGKSAMAQISQSSISFNFSVECEMNKLLPKIEQSINEISKVIKPIGREEYLKYRLGIILTIPMSIKKLKERITYLKEDIFEKPEIEFSYLSTINNDKLFNIWKRYYLNNNKNEAMFVLDCNNSSDTPYYLNETDVKELFESNYKKLIEGAL